MKLSLNEAWLNIVIKAVLVQVVRQFAFAGLRIEFLWGDLDHEFMIGNHDRFIQGPFTILLDQVRCLRCELLLFVGGALMLIQQRSGELLI